MTTALYDKIQYRLAGDCGLLVEFGTGIDPSVNARVRSMAAAMETRQPDGVTEIIPTYRSLSLTYDPLLTTPEKICREIEALQSDLGTIPLPKPRVVEIPVCYDKDFGPDMDNVQENSGLTRDEVVLIHSIPVYLIYMVGFTPGFPFLGGLDRRLYTPRLKTPRLSVPRGSVGIANNQTGMYPVTSPGGWQIIGRTPINLFKPYEENPFLYRAGDKIKFIPIPRDKFDVIAREEGTHEEN